MEQGRPSPRSGPSLFSGCLVESALRASVIRRKTAAPFTCVGRFRRRIRHGRLRPSRRLDNTGKRSTTTSTSAFSCPGTTKKWSHYGAHVLVLGLRQYETRSTQPRFEHSHMNSCRSQPHGRPARPARSPHGRTSRSRQAARRASYENRTYRAHNPRAPRAWGLTPRGLPLLRLPSLEEIPPIVGLDLDAETVCRAANSSRLRRVRDR